MRPGGIQIWSPNTRGSHPHLLNPPCVGGGGQACKIPSFYSKYNKISGEKSVGK